MLECGKVNLIVKGMPLFSCLTLFSRELTSINSENKLGYKLFNLFSPSGFSTVRWILPRFANNVDKTNGTVQTLINKVN